MVIKMKKGKDYGSVYATNESGLIKSPKGKPVQPGATITKGNDLRTRNSKKI